MPFIFRKSNRDESNENFSRFGGSVFRRERPTQSSDQTRSTEDLFEELSQDLSRDKNCRSDSQGIEEC